MGSQDNEQPPADADGAVGPVDDTNEQAGGRDDGRDGHMAGAPAPEPVGLAEDERAAEAAERPADEAGGPAQDEPAEASPGDGGSGSADNGAAADQAAAPPDQIAGGDGESPAGTEAAAGQAEDGAGQDQDGSAQAPAEGASYNDPSAGYEHSGDQYGYDYGSAGTTDLATAEPPARPADEDRRISRSTEYEDRDEPEEDEEELQPKMTLVEHLEELRTRIIRSAIGLVVGVALALIFNRYFIAVIEEPFVKVAGASSLITNKMISPFTLYMKIALYMGILLAAPWIFYQLWMFVSAGLYRRERRYVKMTVPFSVALFLAGAVFFLKVVAYPMLRFFNYFNTQVMGLTQLITLESHIDMMTGMMLVFGLCFQMPIAVLVLAKVGLVTVKQLNHYRRHAIVIIAIVAAIVTVSPSPLDQVALAIPMWLLYELGVVLAYFLVERKRRAEDAADAD